MRDWGYRTIVGEMKGTVFSLILEGRVPDLDFLLFEFCHARRMRTDGWCVATIATKPYYTWRSYEPVYAYKGFLFVFSQMVCSCCFREEVKCFSLTVVRRYAYYTLIIRCVYMISKLYVEWIILSVNMKPSPRIKCKNYSHRYVLHEKTMIAISGLGLDHEIHLGRNSGGINSGDAGACSNRPTLMR